MANNQIAVIQQGANPVEFSKQMGVAYASIVGCTPDQGIGVALAGYCEGLNPVDFKRKYHWIAGKGPSQRADAMLAEFRMNHGGDYVLGTCDDKVAEVVFTDSKKREYACRLTRTQLLLSRNPWKKEPGWAKCVQQVQAWLAAGQTEDQIMAACWPWFGDNYGTPFDWAAMLMARLVSISLRKICPELCAGIYTPEEMADVIEAEVVAPGKPKASVNELLQIAAAKEGIDRMVDTLQSRLAEPPADEDPAPFEPSIDAEFEVKPPLEAATLGNVNRILSLTASLWPKKADQDKAIESALAKRGVSALSLLSGEQAKELIDKLEAMIAQRPS